mmetsp:Transcript_63253/g.148552  ORF Transcript_63253/g.148552 Transcript_63253/m.148552 type:complete len:210 (+) Transcript_63253:469-1098(+)
MDDLQLILGAGDLELFAQRLTEDNCAGVLPVPPAIHGLVGGEIVPGAAHVQRLPNVKCPRDRRCWEESLDGRLVALCGNAINVSSGVCAAESKRRHSTVQTAQAHIDVLAVKIDRIALDCQVRVDDVEMAIGRRSAKVDHHDAFGQSRDASTSLQVSDITLCAGLQDRNLALMHYSHQRPNFDRISQGSSRSVAFSNGDRVRIDASKPH